MALAWIVWRDMAEVEGWDVQWLRAPPQDARLLPWGRESEPTAFNAKVFEAMGYLSCRRGSKGDPVVIGDDSTAAMAKVKQAKVELWEALAVGKVKAEGLAVSDGARLEIPAAEWPELTNEPTISPSIRDEDLFCRQGNPTAVVFRDVVFKAQEVQEHWPAGEVKDWRVRTGERQKVWIARAEVIEEATRRATRPDGKPPSRVALSKALEEMADPNLGWTHKSLRTALVREAKLQGS